MDGYRIERKIAEGRFGTVFAATQSSTGKRVAVKKVRARRSPPGWHGSDPWTKSAEREIEVLRYMEHRHVITLLDHSASPGTGTTRLVYEFLAWDLQRLLERQGTMDESHVKIIMQMLFLGLAHLHNLGIMHRDIKPANLLLDECTGTLKIADFGSARFICPAAAAPSCESEGSTGGAIVETPANAECEQALLTREVCTRWYKSPEMLFGSVDYGHEVDLWASGCVLGELLSADGQPLFPGGSDIDQLCRIFAFMGTPSQTNWPEAWGLPDFGKIEFAPCDAKPFDFEAVRSEQPVELLHQLLRLCPARRSPTAQALDSEFLRAGALSPAVEPSCLVQGLGAPSFPSDDQDDRDFLDEISDYGSDGSDFSPLAGAFEPIPIETTTCGLWDDGAAVPAEEEDEGPPSRHEVAPEPGQRRSGAAGRHHTPPGRRWVPPAEPRLRIFGE